MAKNPFIDAAAVTAAQLMSDGDPCYVLNMENTDGLTYSQKLAYAVDSALLLVAVGSVKAEDWDGIKRYVDGLSAVVSSLGCLYSAAVDWERNNDGFNQTNYFESPDKQTA